MRILAGAVWLLLAALGSAAQEPIDGWLPEGTLFCLSAESPTRTAARLSKGRYATVRGDPAAQRLAVEAKALLATAREASLERGEIWLGSFWELARGPLLLAVVRARGGEAPVVVMDVGDASAFRDHLARLAEAGVLGHEVVRDGIHARPGGEGSGAVFWIERGPVVAFSWREDAVEAVAEHRHGEGLAPRLASVRRKLRPDADVLLYLPREAMAELEERSTDVASLGLADDVTVGLTITLDPDALDVRAFVFAPRPRRGVLALLDEPNAELDPPPFLPADTPAFVAARFDLSRFVGSEAGPLANSFVRALGDRFGLAWIGGEQVFLAEIDRETWMRRLLGALPGRGDGVREGPDGAVAMRDGWLIAAARPEPVRDLLSASVVPQEWPLALPARRVMLWRLSPAPPRKRDDPMRLFAGQAGALVNDPDGFLLVHRALLR